MGILLGIISRLLGSLSVPFRKKSLSLTDIPNSLYINLWNIIGLFIVIVFFVLWYMNTALLTYKFFIFLWFSSILFFSKTPIILNVYKKEKISALLPYENLNKIFIVIISYLFLYNINPVSVSSFVVTLLAIFIIIWFTVDWKKMEVPRSFNNILIRQWLQAIHSLVIAYTISLATDKIYFIMYLIVLTIAFSISNIKNKDFQILPKLSKEFYKNRMIESLLWNTSYIITLFLMSKYGIIITILLSFLWVGMTLLFSFLILWEKPTRKELILTTIVSILVGIWFYLK